jgi:hypothetical protein
MPKSTNCTHIMVSGLRCGSPALRGEQFCYFHQRMLRAVKGPDSRLHHVALLENEEAIQASIMEVVNALIRGNIELKRGELILRALNSAIRNARRVHFGAHTSEMVKQVPDYTDSPASTDPANVGTAAPGCPSGPEVPGRSDLSATLNDEVDPTQPKPALGVKAAPALQPDTPGLPNSRGRLSPHGQIPRYARK